MRRTLAIVATAALTLATLVTGGPAQAAQKFYPTNPELGPFPVNARVWAGTVAHIKKGGDQVRWQVKFQCPKGKRYLLDASVAELNPQRIPILAVDGDNGIEALLREPVTGKCTGRPQVKTLTLYTRVSRWGDGCAGDFCWEAGSAYYPIGPDDNGEARIEVSGQGFEATYIAYAAAAGNNGPYIELRGRGGARVAAAPRHYPSCKVLNADHEHGVGKRGARDSTSGDPVRNFTRNTKLYKANNGPRNQTSGEFDLDRDNDGIACEKA